MEWKLGARADARRGKEERKDGEGEEDEGGRREERRASSALGLASLSLRIIIGARTGALKCPSRVHFGGPCFREFHTPSIQTLAARQFSFEYSRFYICIYVCNTHQCSSKRERERAWGYTQCRRTYMTDSRRY